LRAWKPRVRPRRTACTSAEFLDADAMFPGHRAADGHAQLQDLGAEVLGAFDLAGLPASNRISGCRLPSPAWNTFATGRPAARDISPMRSSTSASGGADGAVHAEVIGGEPADAETPTCARTTCAGVRRRRSPRAATSRRSRAAVPRRPEFALHVVIESVEFTEQQGRGVHRIAAMYEGLGGTDRGCIHHLEAGRTMRGDDAPDGVRAATHVAEAAMTSSTRSGSGFNCTVASTVTRACPRAVNNGSSARPGASPEADRA